MNHWHDEFNKPIVSECPSLWEVLDILEKEFPTPKKEQHIPRSYPAWLRPSGQCEITAGDDAWSRSGREIH